MSAEARMFNQQSTNSGSGTQVASRSLSAAAAAWRRTASSLFKAGWVSRLLGLGLLLGLSVVVGISTVYLPWFVYVGVLLALAYPVLVMRLPWIALGLYVTAVFLAPGFKSADALTVVSLGLFALRWLQRDGLILPKVVARPYLLFLGGVLVAGVIGLVVHRYPIPNVYGDGRGYVYWLWLPLVYALVQVNSDGLVKLARLLAYIAGLVALVALVQYFTGVQFVAAGRVGGLDGANSGQTRVQMHGFLFVLLAVVWAVVSLVHHPRRFWWLVPALLILLAALYANLGRALWIWTGVALLLSAWASGLRRGWAVVLLVGCVSVFGGIGLALFKPQVLDSMTDRFASIQGEGGARTSYGWRKLENQDAWLHIRRSPLVGIGLGGEYRRFIQEIAQFEEHTRYVHNSYAFIALKAGVPALLGLLSLLFVAWWLGYKSTRNPNTVERPLRVAAVASLPPLLGLCITQPELVSPMAVLLFVTVLVLFLVNHPTPIADTKTVTAA